MTGFIRVAALALAMCAPYLGYTWSLTGKLFYWGTSGGVSLYWMSTPHKGEFGDWHGGREVLDNPSLLTNHGAVFEAVDALGQVDKDDYFKRRALENIRAHPGKYGRNILANVGRMLFSYPFSYAEDRMSTFFWLVPNMFLVTAMCLGAYPAWRGRKDIPGELWVLLFIAATTFAGSALLSAYTRQFYILAPLIGLWLSFIAINLVQLRVRTG